MKHHLCPFLIPLISMCVVLPMFGAAEPPTCAEHSIAASAVRTPQDVEAFVQCAYEYVLEEGFSEARRAFNEDERWKSGQFYVFVAEVTSMTDMARAFVYPPDPSREGEPWGLLIDSFGNDYFRELYRIMSIVEEGWIYYSITNPATDREEPKASYVKSIDWDGTPAAIGAGIYQRDIPGTCWSEEVNAMLLDDDPSNERLKEFVRCAAMELEMKGYFAINTLTTDPRWKHGSIYLFAIDTYGYTLFSGDSYSEPDDIMSELVGTDEDQDLVSVEDADAFGEIMSELVGPVEDQDLVSVADAFGESFLYYTKRNPSSEMKERKVSFVKRVVSFGLPILIGAGYYLEDMEESP